MESQQDARTELVDWSQVDTSLDFTEGIPLPEEAIEDLKDAEEEVRNEEASFIYDAYARGFLEAVATVWEEVQPHLD